MDTVLKERTPVEYGNFPVKILSFSKKPYSTCFGLHWHERLEILCIEQGSMVVTCGDTTMTAKAGEVVIVNCKQPHTAHTAKDSVCYKVIMFELSRFVDNPFFGQTVMKQLLLKRVRFQNIVGHRQLFTMCNEILQDGENHSVFSAMNIEGKILQLLALLCERYIDSNESRPMTDAKFVRVLDYLDEYYTQELSVPMLAQRFGYDTAYFCRKFKAQTGVTCMAYIGALRLEQAGILLRKTNDSIALVAERCGYSDANYFSRCFKEKYGKTPLEWRRESV